MRGSKNSWSRQNLRLMVTMVMVHHEVDVIQILENDKGISLINKSLKHLQDQRVPDLGKLESQKLHHA